jgi:hypothetical protein
MKHKTLFGILVSVFYLAFMALVIVLPIVLVKVDNSVPAKATFIVFNCLYLTGLFAYLMGLIVKGDDFYRNFPLNMAVPAKMYPIFFAHLLASSLMFAFVPFGYSWISLIVEFVLLVVFSLVIAKVGVGATIVKDQQDQTKAKVDWMNSVKGKVSLMKGDADKVDFSIKDEISDDIERIETTLDSSYPASPAEAAQVEKEICDNVDLLSSLLKTLVDSQVRSADKFTAITDEVIKEIVQRSVISKAHK